MLERSRWSRGSALVQTSQRQPMTGTPLLVPVPRMVKVASAAALLLAEVLVQKLHAVAAQGDEGPHGVQLGHRIEFAQGIVLENRRRLVHAALADEHLGVVV